jgi:hypothetical protein
MAGEQGVPAAVKSEELLDTNHFLLNLSFAGVETFEFDKLGLTSRRRQNVNAPFARDLDPLLDGEPLLQTGDISDQLVCDPTR